MTLTQPGTTLKQPEATNRKAATGAGSWLTVAKREMAVKLRDRNFIVSTIFLLVLIAASMAYQAKMADQPTQATIAVTSSEGQQLVTGATQAQNAAGGNYALTAELVADENAAKAAIQSGAVDSALVKGPQGWTLIDNKSHDSKVGAALSQSVNAHVLEANALKAGTTLPALQQGATLNEQLLAGDTQAQDVATAVGIIFAILFYLSALLFGMQIATSVVQEKESRVVEILAAAVPIRQLMVGKIIGNTVLALAQLAAFIGIGLIGLRFTEYRDFVGLVASSSGWFVLFFLVGFGVLASLWAVAGSLATRNEDVQSTSMPLTTAIVVVLFIGLGVTGTLQTVASYVPIISTVVMPIRVVGGNAAWWEPILSLAIALAAAYVITNFAAKVYRRSVMQTGKRLSYREALKVED